MDRDNVTIAIPQPSSVIPSNITGRSRDADDGDRTRVCPLCQSEVRLFFINFNEKMFMCENTECEYPFGHEELQFVKEDNELPSDEELDRIKPESIRSQSPMGIESMVSSATWAETEKLDQICKEMDMTALINNINAEKLKHETEILKNLSDIKELNNELLTHHKKEQKLDNIQITNEKWIKNLHNIQEMSGIQLLKPEEISLLKKEEPVIGLGELKIDIDHGDESHISSIKIELHNSSRGNVQDSGEDPHLIHKASSSHYKNMH